MDPKGLQRSPSRGFTLIELLVVVAIVAILALVGVSMIGNRQAAAVRSLLDELEGALTNARQLAVATGRDVAVDSWGTWSAATPLALAYGDAALTDGVIQATANGLLAGTLPPPTLLYGTSVAVPFHFLPNDVTQSRARIVLAGSGDWAAAMTATASGAANADLTTLDPFRPGDSMNSLAAAIAAGTPSLTGTLLRATAISGASQRFTNPMVIEIVGTSPDSGPGPGSAMGLLVVLGNGASIYKFYNPGVREGNGQWRRI